MAEILVVDDEIGIRELLSEILGDEGPGDDRSAQARERGVQGATHWSCSSYAPWMLAR